MGVMLSIDNITLIYSTPLKPLLFRSQHGVNEGRSKNKINIYLLL